MNKKIITLTILILMLPISFALIEDFSAYSKYSQITMYQCSTAADEIIITNNALIASFYTITSEGSAAEYVQTITQRTSIKSGESQTILNIINAPCNIKGTKELVTVIETSTGTQKKIIQQITFKEGNNIEASIVSTNLTTCPQETATFKIKINNTGAFREEYSLKIDKYNEWISSNINGSLKLNEGEAKEAELYFKTPYDKYGEYNFIIFVDADKSGAETQIPVKVNVGKCYDFELINEKQQDTPICAAEYTRIPILLKNTANINNTYSIKYNGPGWSGLDVKTASVGANNDTTLGLIITAPDQTTGTWNANIEVKTAVGNIEKNITIPLIMNECYDISASAQQETKVCQGETVEVPVTVKNKGIFDQIININAEGTMVSSTQTFVKALNETEAELTFNVPEDKLSGKAQITASIASKNDTFSKTSTFFNVITKEECYKPSIQLEKQIQTQEQTDRRIPLIVKNTGIREAEYKVTIEGADWVEADKNKLTLMPEEGIIYLTAQPDETVKEGKYDITVGLIKDEIMYKKTVQIEVAGESAQIKENALLNFIKEYIYYIIAGIVILAILIIVLKIFSKEK